MMWKIALATLLTVVAPTAENEISFYADSLMVTSQEYNKYTDCYDYVLSDQTGTEFLYYCEDGDLFVGDLVSCIFCDNGTDIVTDDTIVTLKYSGYIHDMNSWFYE